MSTFKESIKPFGIKYKFWFAIQHWSDEEILEFLQEDIFDCTDFTLSFDEAKTKCNNSLGKWKKICSIDSIMAIDDQKEMYRILQRY